MRPKQILVFFGLMAGTSALAQTPDWTALSKRIVGETAGVLPGNYVVVDGGKHTLPLMEEIAAELNRKGANPIMVVESDVALRAFWHQKPEANLADYPKHFLALVKSADFLITMPASGNFKEIAQGVDPKRSAILGKSNERLVQEMSRDFKGSIINIAYPTPQQAENAGIDYATYEKMHWAAMGADYKKIEATGQTILKLLLGARSVKITTKIGTNITFSMGNRLAFTDDGILSDEERQSSDYFARYASLPGGFMDFAPDENTVNGIVVVPQGRCDYGPLKEVSFQIKNGVMENFKAKEGQECFERQMAPHTGDKTKVSVFTIGLNPEMKVIINEETNYRPTTAAGFVTLQIGSNNTPYKGTVVSTGGFNFPIAGATLEIDGRVVIVDGKIRL
jgi:leucyl aminopeptidase (aminopeptidase T)